VKLTTPPADYLDAPRIAKQLGVKQQRVLSWIHSGELRAVDVSENGKRNRPRWRIARQALEEFLRERSNRKPTPPPRRRKGRGEIVEYFK